MTHGSLNDSRPLTLLDLLACFAAFAAVSAAYGPLFDPDYFGLQEMWLRDVAVSGFVTWVGIEFLGGGWGGGRQNWLDLGFCAIGANLMMQYGLNYLLFVRPAPWQISALGGMLSVLLIGAVRGMFRRFSPPGASILLVGYDPVARALIPSLRGQIRGILARDPHAVPDGLPLLGDLAGFEEAVRSLRPARIIVTEPGSLAAISQRRLLDLHYSGICVEDGVAVFEDALQRVCWQCLRPADLLLASPLSGNRAVKTLQAIYTNLAGLALLLAAVPLIVVLAIFTGVANRGRMFESVPCSGLQRMPFHLFRFRTRRRNGSVSWMGSLLIKLHLVDLPRLLNVVRGEMVLFGPPPVRREFADRLCRLLPAYPHRFAVKPGLFGWSQANRHGAVVDEAVMLQYDLYYAKQQSPSFDIDILLQTLLRSPRPDHMAGIS